ncbi:hypothetical protein O3P69_001358 [Scylla paramamosain]|uniref:Glycogen debranching enzyme C-terminal domain-containing protein n=1 Tax=Scylla paramamosain TaxID=85552 RepID=A0AAW0USN2_SCYPA
MVGKKASSTVRDAIWFWLQAIQRYVTVDQLLEEVIQEGLQRHFQGVKFRERNAGFQIDRQMNDDGFNNNVGVDLETGFVYGGSVNNCGTWMDKMGSCETPMPESEPRPELIHRRGIYKDSHNASQFWADFQLRCNFPIDIAVAPEMTTPKNAWVALKNAEEILLGPLGIKTLDPKDWAYNGNYDNSNNTADSKLAHGFNYHQGPEWLWPVGWLLRAQLAIAPKVGGTEELARTMGHVKSLMANHLTHLLTSPWRSLPELTDAEGAFCKDSNPAQSWSTGCLLEVLWEEPGYATILPLNNLPQDPSTIPVLCQHEFPTSTYFPLDDNRQHYKLSHESQESSETFDTAYPTLQQRAPQTSRIVITTNNVNPSLSYVKEVDVGNTVISYVPRNIVFSEDPDFFDTVHDVVHVKCFQTDINFSIALLCKPQDISENCLVVWAVDEKVRQNAMWSSPEYLKRKDEKPQISAKVPWSRSKGSNKEQLPNTSSRGPVMMEPLYQSVRSNPKKYQGRVPSIVALLSHHAKSHHKTQKSALQSELPITKVFQEDSSEKDNVVWQQNRFAPMSQEIHRAMAREEEAILDISNKQKADFNRGGGYSFSYHLSPSTMPASPSRPSVLNLPPPPQMPLPPLPEVHDYAEPKPGPSSRGETGLTPPKPSVSWKEFQ